MAERCAATTRAGKRCRRRPAKGADVCHAHGPGGAGRPDGLTPEVEQRIIAAVMAGATREVAAQAAGVGKRTLQRWLARGDGEDAEPRFRSFAQRVSEAGAAMEVGALARVQLAADSDWRAAAWLLRFVRGYPARLELAGPDGGPIALEHDGLDLGKLSDDELTEWQRLAEKTERDG